MVRFMPAAELKNKYDVFGHFYSIEITPSKILECRSVLEIVAKPHTPAKTAAISQQKPDAVFIMMNPGSSQPLVEVDNRIGAKNIHELSISLVPTKPDTTQYQVMRLMHHCDWRHVRVLNLSDLRCTKSVEFFKQYKEVEKTESFDSHSIFSEKRQKELAVKLTADKSMTIVCAWGLSDELNPLIDRCRARIVKNKTLKGLLKDGVTNKYLHPLPSLQKQKILWVNQIIEQFDR